MDKQIEIYAVQHLPIVFVYKQIKCYLKIVSVFCAKIKKFKNLKKNYAGRMKSDTRVLTNQK